MRLHQRETSLILILMAPLLVAAASAPQARPVRAVRFQGADWALYENGKQGYSLRLPPQLKIKFAKTNPRAWSVDNGMPFDYVNFRPQPEDATAAPFELGVGVHWNRDGLSTRVFADKKDEGLISGGAQVEMISQTEAVVCGRQGVRDDFRIRQPSGWTSYSRVIIPHKDRFFVFLGTLGAEKRLVEYERVYQKILDSFIVENAS